MEAKDKNLLVKRPFRFSQLAPLLSHFPTWFEEGFGEDFETVNSSSISLSEDERNLYVEAHVPGLENKDIEITLDKDTLWIKGRKESKEEKERQYYYKSSQSYSYRVTLPNEIDHEAELSATLDKGVIRIVLKKSTRAQPRKIAVK